MYNLWNQSYSCVAYVSSWYTHREQYLNDLVITRLHIYWIMAQNLLRNNYSNFYILTISLIARVHNYRDITSFVLLILAIIYPGISLTCKQNLVVNFHLLAELSVFVRLFPAVTTSASVKAASPRKSCLVRSSKCRLSSTSYMATLKCCTSSKW